MRVLVRVAATLLIAIPLIVALLIMFALASKRRGAVSSESGTSRSLGGGATPGSYRRATGAALEVSR